MSWRTIYFGNEKPSLRRQCLIHFTMLFLLSSPYAFIADFSPENWVFYAGLSISILASLILVFCMWNIRERFSLLMHYSLIKRIVALSSLPLMAFLFTGAFTIYTVPGLTTSVIGRDVRLLGEFDKKEGVTRRSCRYRISSEILKYRFPPYLCVEKSQHERETNKYAVLAKMSFLGVLYEAVE